MVTHRFHLAGQQKKYPPGSSINILLLSCSPRPAKNTHALLQKAAHSLQDISNLRVQSETFSDKMILPCRRCFEYCSAAGRCCLEDDFDGIARQWLQADGILLGSPVYTFGPPAPVVAFFERLEALQQANPAVFLPLAWPQPVGIIAQGGSEYGGVEICAQTLLERCLSVGCVPVSGDMPGFSQGVIGQVPDGQPVSQRLADGAVGLARRVLELVKILSAGRDAQPVPLKFLIVKVGNFAETDISAQIHEILRRTQRGIPVSLDWELFDFDEQQIAPCQACTQYCSSALECQFIDGMQVFRNLWFSADAIIWLIGSENCGSVYNLQAALDRLNQVRFETHFATAEGHMARRLTIAACLTVGQDFQKLGATSRLVRHISMLYQNLLMPSRSCGFGVLGFDMVGKNGEQSSTSSLNTMVGMLEGAARLSWIVRTGLSQLEKSLPREYFHNFWKVLPEPKGGQAKP